MIRKCFCVPDLDVFGEKGKIRMHMDLYKWTSVLYNFKRSKRCLNKTAYLPVITAKLNIITLNDWCKIAVTTKRKKHNYVLIIHQMSSYNHDVI